MAAQMAKGMECVECHAVSPLRPASYSDCHYAPLQLAFNPERTGRELRKEIERGPPTIDRYLPLLPVSEGAGEPVGFTELVQADGLARALGFGKGCLYLKMDHGQRSGTFKDRGVAVAVRAMHEFNQQGYRFRALGATSTGNLAAAVAASAASLNIPSILLLNESAETALVDKALSWGAYVLVVRAGYSAANRIAVEISENHPEWGIAWINTDFRPIYAGGPMTIGYELAEQLGWNSPDNIIHPVAAGLSLARIYAGLKELERWSVIPQVRTRMLAAQPAGFPVVTAWERGDTEVAPVKHLESIAGTLCVESPANGADVLRILKETGGSAAGVSEEDIVAGMGLVEQHTEWRTGPVGGVVVAAAYRLLLEGRIQGGERTVIVLTDAYRNGEEHRGDASGAGAGVRIDIGPDQREIESTLESILAGTARA